MREIDYKKIIKNDEFAVYLVYIDNKCIGKIYIVNNNSKTIVKYNFSEKKFNYITGACLVSEALYCALDTYKNAKESEIYFKDSCDVDHYLESFKIKKEEKNNSVCYTLKR